MSPNVGAALVFVVVVGAWVGWELTADGRPPTAFRERSALPQCAAITVPQGEQVSSDLRHCLLSSEARRKGAEVVVTSLTTEGDPIETYYRVLPGGGGLEVFTDATADSFGSQNWSHVRCPDVAALDDWVGCDPA